MEALRAMEAQEILTIYCDWKTQAAVLLHVRQPERFWRECLGGLALLPPPLDPLDKKAFLTEQTADGWGWAQCIYAEEDADEMPWIYRETFPADPVGALSGREFTLVWRFRHALSIQATLMLKSEQFMMSIHQMRVSGPTVIPMYLYHAQPLGTDVCPYGTLLYYLRLEDLHSKQDLIEIQKRSARGRPIQWKLNCSATTRDRLRAAFPLYFYEAPLQIQTLRTTNWLGLPFLRMIDTVCSVHDLLNQSDAFFLKQPHIVVEHLPILRCPEEGSIVHLIDSPPIDGLLKQYDLSGKRKKVATKRNHLNDGEKEEPPQAKMTRGSASFDGGMP